jgi:hypothetical protein
MIDTFSETLLEICPPLVFPVEIFKKSKFGLIFCFHDAFWSGMY